MTAILTATILIVLATTSLLYSIHLNIFAIRYGLAVITAYAAFVGFIKIWLWYVEYCGRGKSSGTCDDWLIRRRWSERRWGVGGQRAGGSGDHRAAESIIVGHVIESQ